MTDTENPRPVTAAEFDRLHEAEARGTVAARLAAEAYGEEYPAEVQAYGTTTKWVLGRLVSETLLGPGETVVDLACGRGGPRLWLARAMGACLIGVDWSRSAIRPARARIPEFLPEGRARFVVGDLQASGLPDACADGVICMDAVFFAPDVVAAMTEAGRLPKPGRRYVFTDILPDSPDPARRVLDEHVDAAGLELLRKEVVPHFTERLQRMYDLWVAHVDEIATELGRAIAEEMVEEAETVGPTLASRTPYLVTARKPG